MENTVEKIAKIKQELIKGIDNCRRSGGVLFDKDWSMNEGVLLTGYEAEDLVSFIDQTTKLREQNDRLSNIVKILLERSEKNRNHIEVWETYALLKDAEQLLKEIEQQ